MPAWAAVLIALIGTSTTAASLILGIQKARDDRAARQATDARADRTDVITVLTNDRDFWRSEALRERQSALDEREKREAAERELLSVVKDADHVADVAQAAMLAFRRGEARVPHEPR